MIREEIRNIEDLVVKIKNIDGINIEEDRRIREDHQVVLVALRLQSLLFRRKIIIKKEERQEIEIDPIPLYVL
jgi:hypothetical protein